MDKYRIRYQIKDEDGNLGPRKEVEKYFPQPNSRAHARGFARSTLKADKIISITLLAD